MKSSNCVSVGFSKIELGGFQFSIESHSLFIRLYFDVNWFKLPLIRLQLVLIR